jgi:hypothetical protein
MMGDHPAPPRAIVGRSANNQQTSCVNNQIDSPWRLHKRRRIRRKWLSVYKFRISREYSITSLCKFQSNQILFFFPLFIIFVLNNPTRLK